LSGSIGRSCGSKAGCGPPTPPSSETIREHQPSQKEEGKGKKIRKKEKGKEKSTGRAIPVFPEIIRGNSRSDAFALFPFALFS
jgi:hypothetical protein